MLVAHSAVRAVRWSRGRLHGLPALATRVAAVRPVAAELGAGQGRGYSNETAGRQDGRTGTK